MHAWCMAVFRMECQLGMSEAVLHSILPLDERQRKTLQRTSKVPSSARATRYRLAFRRAHSSQPTTQAHPLTDNNALA